jgi:hypothetical protein
MVTTTLIVNMPHFPLHPAVSPQTYNIAIPLISTNFLRMALLNVSACAKQFALYSFERLVLYFLPTVSSSHTTATRCERSRNKLHYFYHPWRTPYAGGVRLSEWNIASETLSKNGLGKHFIQNNAGTLCTIWFLARIIKEHNCSNQQNFSLETSDLRQ